MKEFWERSIHLPQRARAESICLAPDDTALIGTFTEQPGLDDPQAELQSRKSTIFSWESQRLRVVFEGEGAVKLLARHENVRAALLAKIKPSGEGSDYTLLRSIDGGKNWRHCGAVPIAGVGHMLLTDERTVWLSAHKGGLALSRDEGGSWRAVTPAEDFGILLQQAAPEGIALLGKGGAFTSDEGKRWVRFLSAEHHVTAAQWPYLVVSINGVGVFGRWEGHAYRPIASLPKDLIALKVSVTDQVIRILVRASNPQAAHSAGVAVLRSEDFGKTWISIPTTSSAIADIVGGVHGIAIDYGGTVCYSVAR